MLWWSRLAHPANLMVFWELPFLTKSDKDWIMGAQPTTEDTELDAAG